MEENVNIVVLTNSFMHPGQCFHLMVNEIPLDTIKVASEI